MKWSLTAATQLSSTLERAGFVHCASDVGSTWVLPAGCAIVIFSWGPQAEWITREAGKQARRMLAAGTGRPTRSYRVAFCEDASARASVGGTQTGDAVDAAGVDLEASRLWQVQSCVDRVGLRVSDTECRNAAHLIGQPHMPDTAVDMVVQRFIQPLVTSVECTESRQLKLDILRTDAPFSGAAEYVESLPEAALQHMDVAYWAHHFLVSQCVGGVPPSLYGLRVGGDARLVGDGRLSVSSMSIAGVHTDAFRVTAGPQLLATAISVLGEPPADCLVLYHGTTASSLESVMTDPSPDRSWGPWQGPRQDFGGGLYVTSQAKQALAWAKKKQSADNPAAVVVWYVPRDLYAGLRCLSYEYDDDFKTVVMSWHVLENAALRDFKRRWPDSRHDVVRGPVSRLRPGVPFWSPATALGDILTLNCAPFGSRDGPAWGDQYVFRTATATDVLCDARTRVCGVVLLQPGAELGAPGR